MGKPLYWPPETIAALRQAAADGLTPPQAAERLGIAVHHVHNLRYRLSVPFKLGKAGGRMGPRKRRQVYARSTPAETNWSGVAASLRW